MEGEQKNTIRYMRCLEVSVDPGRGCSQRSGYIADFQENGGPSKLSIRCEKLTFLPGEIWGMSLKKHAEAP